jgi:hypothetical protein
MGPYVGPEVGIFIAVRFRPKIDPDRAERVEDCGTVSPIGACSLSSGTRHAGDWHGFSAAGRDYLRGSIETAWLLQHRYDLARTTNEIYAASATIDDLTAAAKDLGLTEDDVTACQKPL